MGAEAVGDLRRHNRGALPKLNDEQQANLLQAIRGVAPDGGLWNGRKVANYLTEVLGTPVSRQQGWEYLKAMELRLRVPRPQHQETDLAEQEAWKKSCTTRWNRYRSSIPTPTSRCGVKMSTASECNP
jgi:transposase